MTIEENKERELLIMSLISLQNSSELEVTILSNRFIDNFMPRANGEFVKVYIYLLRMVSAAPSSFSLEHMADSLFFMQSFKGELPVAFHQKQRMPR